MTVEAQHLFLYTVVLGLNAFATGYIMGRRDKSKQLRERLLWEYGRWVMQRIKPEWPEYVKIFEEPWWTTPWKTFARWRRLRRTRTSQAKRLKEDPSDIVG